MLVRTRGVLRNDSHSSLWIPTRFDEPYYRVQRQDEIVREGPTFTMVCGAGIETLEVPARGEVQLDFGELEPDVVKLGVVLRLEQPPTELVVWAPVQPRP